MYRLPKGMRFSSLQERKAFYAKEFSTKKVGRWLGGRENTVFAIIVGRHTDIYPREYADIKKNTVIVDDYKDLEDLREYILQYLPEAVYYDRNLYADIHACEKCARATATAGTAKASWVRSWPSTSTLRTYAARGTAR